MTQVVSGKIIIWSILNFSSIAIFTSCNQYNFLHWGFDCTWHSKYTSSPSFISSADNVEPKRNDTIGGSVGNREKNKNKNISDDGGKY